MHQNFASKITCTETCTKILLVKITCTKGSTFQNAIFFTVLFLLFEHEKLLPEIQEKYRKVLFPEI